MVPSNRNWKNDQESPEIASDPLTRNLEHVNTEMSLHVLAYKLKRVTAILGVARTMKGIRVMGCQPPSSGLYDLMQRRCPGNNPRLCNEPTG